MQGKMTTELVGLGYVVTIQLQTQNYISLKVQIITPNYQPKCVGEAIRDHQLGGVTKTLESLSACTTARSSARLGVPPYSSRAREFVPDDIGPGDRVCGCPMCSVC